MMNVNDPREVFIDSIDLAKSRVRLETKLRPIFICGGSINSAVFSFARIFPSARKRVTEFNEKKLKERHNFIIADNIHDWHEAYGEDGLADFEFDIAYLASVILIFVESPGSLAELGLFFYEKKIRNKLLIFLHDKHYNVKRSFIKDALLTPIEREYENKPENARPVKTYSPIKIWWKKYMDNIQEIIRDYTGKNTDTEKFIKSNRGHAILLIYQLLGNFILLTKEEVLQYSKEVLPISEKKVDAALYILQKFNLISCESNFFFCKHNMLNNKFDTRIDFRFDATKPGRKFNDQKRFQILLMDFYRNSAEQNKNQLDKERVKIIDKELTSEAL